MVKRSRPDYSDPTRYAQYTPGETMKNEEKVTTVYLICAGRLRLDEKSPWRDCALVYKDNIQEIPMSATLLATGSHVLNYCEFLAQPERGCFTIIDQGDLE